MYSETTSEHGSVQIPTLMISVTEQVKFEACWHADYLYLDNRFYPNQSHRVLNATFIKQ